MPNNDNDLIFTNSLGSSKHFISKIYTLERWILSKFEKWQWSYTKFQQGRWGSTKIVGSQIYLRTLGNIQGICRGFLSTKIYIHTLTTTKHFSTRLLDSSLLTFFGLNSGISRAGEECIHQQNNNKRPSAILDFIALWVTKNDLSFWLTFQEVEPGSHAAVTSKLGWDQLKTQPTAVTDWKARLSPPFIIMFWPSLRFDFVWSRDQQFSSMVIA